MAGERKKNRYAETRVGTEKGRDTSASAAELRKKGSELFWKGAAMSHFSKERSSELRERTSSVLDQMNRKQVQEYREREKLKDVNAHKKRTM